MNERPTRRKCRHLTPAQFFLFLFGLRSALWFNCLGMLTSAYYLVVSFAQLKSNRKKSDNGNVLVSPSSELLSERSNSFMLPIKSNSEFPPLCQANAIFWSTSNNLWYRGPCYGKIYWFFRVLVWDICTHKLSIFNHLISVNFLHSS